MKIAISSGHAKFVSGAVGLINEVEEARKVVPKVATYLKHLGVDVIEYHDDTSSSQTTNINSIVAFHNAQERDMDISIHFNAFSRTEDARGVEVLYLNDVRMAAKVSQAISDVSGLRNRGAKQRTDLGFLNRTNKPAILIEVCFVDSAADVLIYQNKFDEICKSIAETICGKKLSELHSVSENSIRAMQSLGIIQSPEYWQQVTDIQCLDVLMQNVAEAELFDSRIDNGITDIDVAFDVLEESKIINTPEYWRNLVNEGVPFIKELLINMANRSRIVLEKIVHAEARGEDLKGQQLVANVILNRHRHKTFPTGVHNVVFQSRKNADGSKTYQFTPIIDGAYSKAIPSDSVKNAVTDALRGQIEDQGALYFCSVASAKNPTNWHENNLEFLFEHGGHRFYK